MFVVLSIEFAIGFRYRGAWVVFIFVVICVFMCFGFVFGLILVGILNVFGEMGEYVSELMCK